MNGENVTFIQRLLGRKRKEGESHPLVTEYKTLQSEIGAIEDVRNTTMSHGYLRLMTEIMNRINTATEDIDTEYRSDNPSEVVVKALLAKRDAFIEFTDLVNETIAAESIIRRKLKLLQETIDQANLNGTRQSAGEPRVDIGAL